jgi:hypothetical protein
MRRVAKLAKEHGWLIQPGRDGTLAWYDKHGRLVLVTNNATYLGAGVKRTLRQAGLYVP